MLKFAKRLKMFIGYVFLGVLVGFVSGFFGIGGGAVVVPAMILLGYDIKYAIGVSIMQMVFSSIFGSFVNLRSKMLDLKPALVLGLGGFCGALSSGFIVSHFSSKFLLGALITAQMINLTKLLTSPLEPKGEQNSSQILLFAIGLITGAVAISVGIGGSVFVMPALIGFLNYDIKKAVSTGLFFVVFSSTAGFISLASHGLVHYDIGVTIGIGSLFGVYFGVKTSHAIDKKKQKYWMIALITTILVITIRKFLVA
ncbi:sulfite exporter TauE/SafE family protein [Campylobacter sp. CCUG 57310]|uniref:sulfite exporter TauE/SafE family protein n=1 Tax=Campylobacter sp. CCUG 57310 TaxID=2517362 RepID=UPI0020B15796|nr:sulfite exporter TauE/SafE family protein [Campylobacter sp. CCUG 57310]